MTNKKTPKIVISIVFGLILSLINTYGFYASKKYNTFLYSGTFLERISLPWLLLGIILFVLFALLAYAGFSFLSGRKALSPGKELKLKRWQYFLIFSAVIYVVYVIYLIGCYPGFFNYDMGNQLIQVMYDTPINTHHPLLHTLIGSWIIMLGYHIKSIDLKFGIFLYNAVQMAICAGCFGYTLAFLYSKLNKKLVLILGGIFYLFCPPIIMFAMSTTKDVPCYAFMTVACVCLFELYEKIIEGDMVKRYEWILTCGFIVLTCLLRNNIVYAVPFAGLVAICLVKKVRIKQLIFWLCCLILPLAINKGLALATGAASGSIAEAMSVPFQQITRLYIEEGEEAFTEDELEYLYTIVDQECFSYYDPIIADKMKTSFWQHIDVIEADMGKFIGFWIKKGLEYPRWYIEAFLDNTYQAWYPFTILHDTEKTRYFMVTEWDEEYSNPRIPALYYFFLKVYENEYQSWPVVRLFFTIGTMFVSLITAFFYAIWKKDMTALVPFVFTLLVCATCMLGPVSDLRYYLMLFYMFPLSIVYMLKPTCNVVK